MGNRSIIYTQEQPRTFDVLNGWRDTLIAEGYLEQDIAGNSTTVVGGFVATPSSPASLVINLTAGRIYEQAEVDAAQYGSLPPDTDLIMQQGFAAAQTVTLSTAALTAGQSQWALIEVGYNQTDVIRANDPTGGVLYYWNSSNPTVPFQGPNGDGGTQPTEREGVATVNVIYGSPASTGSEVPPNPSAGYVPLYLIDLAYGQTAVTSGEIIFAGPSVGANVPNNYPWQPQLAGLLRQHHTGQTGQAPKILLTGGAEVQGTLPPAFLAAFTSDLITDGYCEFPGGLILQWGTGVNSTGNQDVITFPLAFPNACLCVRAGEANAQGSGGWASKGPTIYGVDTLTKTTFKLSCMGTGVISLAGASWGFMGDVTYSYIAIGY